VHPDPWTLYPPAARAPSLAQLSSRSLVVSPAPISAATSTALKTLLAGRIPLRDPLKVVGALVRVDRYRNPSGQSFDLVHGTDQYPPHSDFGPHRLFQAAVV